MTEATTEGNVLVIGKDDNRNLAHELVNSGKKLTHDPMDKTEEELEGIMEEPRAKADMNDEQQDITEAIKDANTKIGEIFSSFIAGVSEVGCYKKVVKKGKAKYKPFYDDTLRKKTKELLLKKEMQTNGTIINDAKRTSKKIFVDEQGFSEQEATYFTSFSNMAFVPEAFEGEEKEEVLDFMTRMFTGYNLIKRRMWNWSTLDFSRTTIEKYLEQGFEAVEQRYNDPDPMRTEQEKLELEHIRRKFVENVSGKIKYFDGIEKIDETVHKELMPVVDEMMSKLILNIIVKTPILISCAIIKEQAKELQDVVGMNTVIREMVEDGEVTAEEALEIERAANIRKKSDKNLTEARNGITQFVSYMSPVPNK